jgi:hypothetical protein
MKNLYHEYRVAPEQVDACQRYVDESTNTVFYLVPSASEAGLFYKVEWNRNFHRFSCQCKANQNGMSCWHIRAVLVHATQFAEIKRAEAEAQAMRVAYHNDHPTEPTEAEIKAAQERYCPRPFTILK